MRPARWIEPWRKPFMPGMRRKKTRRAAAVIGADGAYSPTAKALGLHPNTLRSRMKKLGIERPRE